MFPGRRRGYRFFDRRWEDLFVCLEFDVDCLFVPRRLCVSSWSCTSTCISRAVCSVNVPFLNGSLVNGIDYSVSCSQCLDGQVDCRQREHDVLRHCQLKAVSVRRNQRHFKRFVLLILVSFIMAELLAWVCVWVHQRLLHALSRSSRRVRLTTLCPEFLSRSASVQTEYRTLVTSQPVELSAVLDFGTFLTSLLSIVT